MSLLIANGCSHTAGAEIEYEMQGECYNRAWPKKFGDSLGVVGTNGSTLVIVGETFDGLKIFFKNCFPAS